MFSRLRNRFFNRMDIRLTIYYTLILLFLFALLASFCLVRLQHHLVKQLDQMLRDEVLELELEVSQHADIAEGCREAERVLSRRRAYPLYFRVMDPVLSVLYTSSALVRRKPPQQLVFAPVVNEPRYFATIEVPRRSPFRCYQKRITRDDQVLTIQLATPTSSTQKIVENLTENIILITPVLLFLSIAFGLLASRQPFQIIRSINQITRQITSKNLRERLPLSAAGGEVKDLTETINSMLERLETSFEALKQFTGDASHELRTPLFALKGELEVAIHRERESSEYREIIGNCLERVDSLIKMVNDLLLIARLESQKVLMQREPISLAKTVHDLYDFFAPMAQEKSLVFSIDRCDDVTANVDKTTIQQLFSNLIDNAVKFTPERESIVLSLVQQNGAVEFRVKDTGKGIAPEEIPKIFERFYQVDASRSDPARGSGLGLQICKRIVEAHGGTIAIEQNGDRGVTFVVRLPLAE